MNATYREALRREQKRASTPAFEPYTMVRAAPMQGCFVNVSRPGYRHGANAPTWPPDTQVANLFVFGGSMAFGYGLTDAETIPARIEARFRAQGREVAVYNFASPLHAGIEERIRFEELLLAGHVPAMALFLDGFSELVAPHYAAAIRGPFRRALQPRRWWRRALPILSEPVPPPTEIIARYRRGMTLITALARAFGVAPLFVWQPAPCWRYPGSATSAHATGHDDARAVIADVCTGYELMDRARAEFDPASFLWLADLQGDRYDELYVDPDHYNALFSDEIAAVIVPAITRLLPA